MSGSGSMLPPSTKEQVANMSAMMEKWAAAVTTIHDGDEEVTLIGLDG
jgi:hypothetical protein